MDEKTFAANYDKLKCNEYPGRGIILGLSLDSKYLVQVYWIMGRSLNSRNRIFVKENGFVKTKAFDESKMTDPSLIIYYPVKHLGSEHIVTNGDQTDTIYETLAGGGSFEKALDTRCFEPDFPNLTPRISGLISLGDSGHAYKLSILKSFHGKKDSCIRHYFCYERAHPGIGHCIHTYAGDGEPLPSFVGEPFELAVLNDIDETAEFYWKALNEKNRVAILVKYICKETKSFDIRIINKLK